MPERSETSRFLVQWSSGHITHDLRDAKISHTLGLYIPGLLFTSRYMSSLTNLWGAKSVLVFFTRYPNTSFRVQNKQKRNEIIHKTKERLSPYWYNALEASYNMFNCFRTLFSNFVFKLCFQTLFLNFVFLGHNK